jgi:uncharacterized membrane protein
VEPVVSIDPASFVLALVIVLVEMTEVVVLVFALGAGEESLRHAAAGAGVGVVVVGGAAVLTGAAIERLPDWLLLGVAAVLLASFGVVLARSTRRAYRKAAAAAAHPGEPAPPPHQAIQFAGGFTAGAVETLEAVIVLISLAAAGQGSSAIIGAAVAGVVLVVATALVHERVRRIKVPQLKLFGTGMLFSFAIFWGASAFDFNWPGGDLVLIPLVLLVMATVRLWIGEGHLSGTGSSPA